MKWPWKRDSDDDEAKKAIRDAEQLQQAAHEISSQADLTARSARELTRRTDRFAREVERSMYLRRGPT